LNAASLSTTGAANVGGALAVTGATTLTGALTANGGITTTTLNATGNASIGGTLDMKNNKITGVANGTATYDAVNFGQMQEVRKMLSAGIASTAAMSNIPLVDPSKSFAVGVGLGSYDGQTSIAMGASYRLSPSAVLRGSVAGGSNSKTTVGAGVGFSW
jgi:hypothetical protein